MRMVEWIKLGDIGEVCMCKRIMKEQTSDHGDVPFFKIGTFGAEPDSYISKALYNEYKSKYSYPKKGDILLSAAGTIGRTVIFDDKDSYFQDSNIVWIDNNEKTVLNKYLFYYYQIVNWKTDGGTIKRLYNYNLKNILIAIPSKNDNLDYMRKPITSSKRKAGIYPYYGASGIVDYVEGFIFDGEYLLVSEDGANLLMRTYPIAFPISGKVWVNNHAHVLRFKSIVTQKYVEYCFSGMKLDEYITGAAQPKLTQKALNSIIINLPSTLDEQQSIVATLDSLKSKVDRLKANYDKISQECDALKQSILRQVFE